MTDNVDWTFIQGNEGTRTDGYVPLDSAGNPVDRSGVTVATGVDLGQMGQAGLASLGLDATLVNLLTPFLGLRGSVAVNFLAANPLNLTPSQVTDLDDAYRTQAFNTVEAAFNGTRSAEVPAFGDLPSPAQTVVMDVAWQYGNNLAARTPTFWAQVTSGRWADAVDELNDFHDHFPTRRSAEADLLQTAIDDGTLTATDTGKEATDDTGKEATDGTGKEATDGTGKEATDDTGKEATDGTGKEATDDTGKEATDNLSPSPGINETAENRSPTTSRSDQATAEPAPRDDVL